MNCVKIISGGATGVEAKVNDWLSGEGTGLELKSIQTCAFSSQKAPGEAPVHTVIVTIWYQAR
ncbi:MAG: hypothetical protein JOY77_09220 [Alphaproteobacteria bacterium]|nr:hypothetical protein [Alphaproteobacteria bacterium]MBV9063090.1 hypothetical protein [Alphaproteobacteria bacterium]